MTMDRRQNEMTDLSLPTIGEDAFIVAMQGSPSHPQQQKEQLLKQQRSFRSKKRKSRRKSKTKKQQKRQQSEDPQPSSSKQRSNRRIVYHDDSSDTGSDEFQLVVGAMSMSNCLPVKPFQFQTFKLRNDNSALTAQDGTEIGRFEHNRFFRNSVTGEVEAVIHRYRDHVGRNHYRICGLHPIYPGQKSSKEVSSMLEDTAAASASASAASTVVSPPSPTNSNNSNNNNNNILADANSSNDTTPTEETSAPTVSIAPDHIITTTPITNTEWLTVASTKSFYQWAEVKNSNGFGMKFSMKLKGEPRLKFVSEHFGPSLWRWDSRKGFTVKANNGSRAAGVTYMDTHRALVLGPGIDPSLMACFAVVIGDMTEKMLK